MATPQEKSRRHQRGLLDTSALIDLDILREDDLPVEMAISAVTIAELAAGPHATDDAGERAARVERLQAAEATFDHLPFDASAARAYGRVYAALLDAGRKARGRRALDMLIAATALASGLPLYTCNPSDFDALAGLLDIVAVGPPADAAIGGNGGAADADAVIDGNGGGGAPDAAQEGGIE